MAGNVKCVIIHRFLLISFSTGHFLPFWALPTVRQVTAPASSKATHKTVITHKVLVLYLQHASPSRTQAESLLGPGFLERSKSGHGALLLVTYSSLVPSSPLRLVDKPRPAH